MGTLARECFQATMQHNVANLHFVKSSYSSQAGLRGAFWAILKTSSAWPTPFDNGTHKITAREYSAVKRPINNLPGLTPATILNSNILKLRRPAKPG
jgi:hypothetical protein